MTQPHHSASAITIGFSASLAWQLWTVNGKGFKALINQIPTCPSSRGWLTSHYRLHEEVGMIPSCSVNSIFNPQSRFHHFYHESWKVEAIQIFTTRTPLTWLAIVPHTSDRYHATLRQCSLLITKSPVLPRQKLRHGLANFVWRFPACSIFRLSVYTTGPWLCWVITHCNEPFSVIFPAFKPSSMRQLHALHMQKGEESPLLPYRLFLVPENQEYTATPQSLAEKQG